MWSIVWLACSGPAETPTVPTPTEVEDTTEALSVLIVMDNSDSMVEEAQSVAIALDSLVADLEARPDTVSVQLAFATTDVARRAGQLLGAGVLSGADLSEQSQAALLCEGTCFTGATAVPAAPPSYSCGDPLGTFLTRDYLDCTCGDGAWVDNCGATTEEGLEALFLIGCRASASPVQACTDADSGLVDEDLGGLTDLVEGQRWVVVIVSDGADASRRQAQEPTAGTYVDLLTDLGLSPEIHAVVPALTSAGELMCPGTGSDWGVARYVDAAAATGGQAWDIHDESCDTLDVGGVLSSVLGSL
ncbi:MAG: hypothetical protein KTR31_12115 [Myxococcales bacterium]|nr:hypothetical protein [Myxococcales bacterium]